MKIVKLYLVKKVTDEYNPTLHFSQEISQQKF